MVFVMITAIMKMIMAMMVTMTVMVTIMVTMTMMMMVKDDNGGKCNGEWSTAGARVAAHSPTVILIITIRKI